MKPVVIDLCCGLGGWSQGFLSEGWDAIGFDIERHEYGDKRYPGELILKSILEINGYDLRAVNPALVVASPPCQEFSYMAMPWKRGKQIAGALREQCLFPEGYDGSRTVAELTALYDACFRIARQIGCPIVLENVKGAQPWVGRAKANYGSYYLWGDVASVGGRVVRADAPVFGSFAQARRRQLKRDGRNFHAFENGLGSSPGLKTSGHVNIRDGFDHTRHLTNQRKSDGVKQAGHSGRAWFADSDVAGHFSSKSDSRKAASAMIAEIPFFLAQYIARAFKPNVD